MIKPAALAVFAAMAGPSAALGDLQPLAPSPDIVDAAPPEYWSPPDAPFVMLVGSPRAVDAVCTQALPLQGRDYVVLACTRDDRRMVLMPNPCLYQHEYYAKLLCHEQAHLSRQGLPGWKH